MFQYYNNILTIEAGALYTIMAVMTKPTYDWLCGQKKINVIRRGCKGTPALVEYASLPERFREVIEEKYGDPRLTTKHNRFIDHIEIDPKANEFYTNYTLDNGQALPEKAKNEYIANAMVLNAIKTVVNQRMARTAALVGKTSRIWDSIAQIVQELPKHTYPHNLPANVRRLKAKYEQYNKEGYQCLVHKGYCHKNSEKITDEAKPWLLSRWADRVNRCATYAQLLGEYNAKAADLGWKMLKNERTLELYLNREELVHLWYGNRMGEQRSKEKHTLHISTKMPTMRDSLWYSDGTKLNLYYLDDNGKMATCQVYEVMDAYSEVFLGFHVSQSENYEAQYYAYKMAVQTAGHRPYQIKFDNQGGHKKLEAGNFLKKLAKIATTTQPYNGKSKTIESAFGRFQQKYLAKYWFFTGQNITAKKVGSKANMEFIMANNESIPTLKEAIAIYKEAREKWNADIHAAHGVGRWDAYVASKNPATPKIELFDMVDLFWIERPQPITYTAYGLTFQEKGEKHTYLVYNQDGMPDIEWHKRNIDKKFVVRFDPEDMSAVWLYERDHNGLRFVTEAKVKIAVPRGAQEQTEYDRKLINHIIEANKQSRISSQDQIDTIQEEFGMLPEQYGLKSPALRGVKNPKQVKARRLKRQEADHDKLISNLIPVSDNDDDIDDLYSQM